MTEYDDILLFAGDPADEDYDDEDEEEDEDDGTDDDS